MLQAEYSFDESSVGQIFDADVLGRLDKTICLPDVDLLSIVRDSPSLERYRSTLMLVHSAGLAMVPVDRQLGFDEQHAKAIANATFSGGIILSHVISGDLALSHKTERYVRTSYGKVPDIDVARDPLATTEEYAEACHMNGVMVRDLAYEALVKAPNFEEPLETIEDKLIENPLVRPYFRVGAGVLMHVVMQAEMDALRAEVDQLSAGTDLDAELAVLLGESQ